LGDVANMMIDGTLCQECGAYLDGDSPGHPRNCGNCTGSQFHRRRRIPCKNCGVIGENKIEPGAGSRASRRATDLRRMRKVHQVAI